MLYDEYEIFTAIRSANINENYYTVGKEYNIRVSISDNSIFVYGTVDGQSVGERFSKYIGFFSSWEILHPTSVVLDTVTTPEDWGEY